MSPYRTAIGPPFWSAATIVPPVEAHELGSVSLLRWDQCNFRFARALLCNDNSQASQTPQSKIPRQFLFMSKCRFQPYFVHCGMAFRGLFSVRGDWPWEHHHFAVCRLVLERIFNKRIEAWHRQDEEREKEVHHPTKFDRAYRAHRNNQACRNRNVRFEDISPHGCHMYYTRSKHLYEYDLSTIFSEEILMFSYSPWIKHGARDVIGNSITICVRKGPMPCTVTE